MTFVPGLLLAAFSTNSKLSSLYLLGVEMQALWLQFVNSLFVCMGKLSVTLPLCIVAVLEQPELLYPASILIAYGGYTVLMTNLQLGNLIPRFRSTIISLYCGAYDSSAFVLIFVKV